MNYASGGLGVLPRTRDAELGPDIDIVEQPSSSDSPEPESERASCDEDEGEDETIDGVTWAAWPATVASWLSFPWPLPVLSTKFTIVTACSGTDSPVVALEQVVGAMNVKHAASIDNLSVSKSFILSNFAPAHWYDDVDALVAPTAHCSVCNRHCAGLLAGKVDFFVAGFPCKSFSVMNPQRWNPYDDSFMAESAKPFLRISEYLHGVARECAPRCVILENVAGMLRRSGSKSAPVDVLMNGKVQTQGGLRDVGLLTCKQYHCRQLPLQSCESYGLPLQRRRVFWVLLNRDDFTSNDVDDLVRRVYFLNGRKLFPDTTLANFFPVEIEDCSAAVPKVRRLTPISQASVNESNAFRRKFSLPPFGTANSAPYSSTAPPSMRSSLSRRELDVMDCAYLFWKAMKGAVPEELIVDVSQKPTWEPWTASGKLKSPTTNSKLVYKGRFVPTSVLFSCLGWPDGVAQVPDDITDRQARILLGNIISPPVIGGIFTAILAGRNTLGQCS